MPLKPKEPPIDHDKRNAETIARWIAIAAKMKAEREAKETGQGDLFNPPPVDEIATKKDDFNMRKSGNWLSRCLRSGFPPQTRG